MSLVAHTVKNPPAMWETQVRSLGWKDTLEKEMATHSREWENSVDRVARWVTVHVLRSWHDWVTNTHRTVSVELGVQRGADTQNLELQG